MVTTVYFDALEKKAARDVRISSECILCGKCVRICPMKNFEISDQSMVLLNQCTLCYRCVNQCPQKAITVLVHTKVTKQYQGINLSISVESSNRTGYSWFFRKNPLSRL
ncbi:4Fe-4S dicluster domain-containing protein [Acetobacterium wieringae]|uniref:4Fe-4S dicluster domain-containing protein n=1 Tax=Acetobacterium wieringae TaxID=52694 RepID=A0A5D0WL01_9FIRM|nr:4Fe-4S dicluster domain-containing protein [Acetobacterium wieringae]